MVYPLEAARTVREQELAAAKTAASEATQKLVAAEQAVETARAQYLEHQEHTRAAQLRQTRLEARSAQDLLQGQSYLERRRAEAETLSARVERAKAEVRAAASALERAREVLAQARAELEAVERHYARWKAAQAKKAERKAEDEADDLNSSRH